MQPETSYAGWVARYIAAWRSNEAEDIRALFSDDAEYFTEPTSAAWRGRSEIVDRWLERKDPPDGWTFDYSVLARGADVGIVRGLTTYATGQVFENLWEIYLDEQGRAAKFVEWWAER